MASISGSSSRTIKHLKSCLTPVVATFTATGGAYNNASQTVTHASNTNIRLGMTVTSNGAGIPANAYVLKINSATEFILSANATSTSSGRTLTFATGYLGALQEVGRQTGDLETVTGADEEAAYTAMRDIIHRPGNTNPFFGGDANQPPNAEINLLAGCKVYKRIDSGGGTGTEYWRTFLYTKDSHGLAVNSGSSLANLENSNGVHGSDYAVGFSLTNGMFNEPLRVLSNPTTTTARVDFGQTRGGFQTVIGPATMLGGAFHGLMDIVSDNAFDTPLVGDEITMPAGNIGNVMDFGLPNGFMYYVLDEDNIVLYTNRCIHGQNTTLNHEEDRTFLCVGRGGSQTGADEFSSAVTVNPTSLAITNSFGSTQVLPSSIKMVEFWATGGDTTIELGIHKQLTDSGYTDNSITYSTSSPSIVIPQDTKFQVAINTFEIGGFRAKTSNGSGDTLYWNFIVG